MDRHEAERKFREADGQFKAQHFGVALELLNELDEAFPRTPRILNPKALCLSKLGRNEEALEICATLITELNYPKAAALQQEILRQTQAAPKISFDFSGLDDILGPSAKRAAPPPVREEGRNWKPWLIVGAVAAVLVVLALPLMLGGGGDDDETLSSPSPSAGAEIARSATPAERTESRAQPDELPESPVEAVEELRESYGIRLYVIAFFGLWFANFWLMFIALGLMRKLPGETFFENAGDVGVVSLVISLVAFVKYIGFFTQLIIVSRKYDLSCGEVVLFVVIQVVIVLAVFGLLGVVLLGLMGAALEAEPALLVGVPAMAR